MFPYPISEAAASKIQGVEKAPTGAFFICSPPAPVLLCRAFFRQMAPEKSIILVFWSRKPEQFIFGDKHV